MSFLPLVYKISALAPLALMAAVALLAALGRFSTASLWQILRVGSFAALAMAVLALFTSSLGALWSGVVQASALSMVTATLVQLLGTVIGGFSSRYLQGERGQPRYIAALASVLAAVHLLVLADHWLVLIGAWAFVGVALQYLLCFYADRPFALLAAHKKRIADRLADVLLIIAAALAWLEVGSGSLSALREHVLQHGISPALQVSAVALVLAVILRTALLPVHGWLIQVMEAPTPVSALLHAGVVNAGGYLLIRFVDVMLLSPLTLAMLVMIGALTAIFGSLVMLTQSAVKTSLAWSTVAQMGFMILQCGLTLFPVALLHIIAHSLYKAHAFLSSGSAVEATLAVRRPGPVATPNVRAVLRAFLLALVIYALAGLAFGFWHKPPQALALGAILIFGVAYLIAQGLADAAPWQLTWRTSLIATAAAVSYFALQWAAYALTAGVLPPAPEPGALVWALIILSLLTFGFTAFAQSLFPLWAHHPAVAGLRVHLQNGLYVNALFDRMLGNFNTVSPAQDRM